MDLAGLLSQASSLPEAQQRKVAAILGSLVADAAGRSNLIKINILIQLENVCEIIVHGVSMMIDLCGTICLIFGWIKCCHKLSGR